MVCVWWMVAGLRVHSSSSFYTPYVQCFTEGRQPWRVLHCVGKECAHAPHGLVPKLIGWYFVALHTGAGPERSCPQEHGSNNQVHLSAWRTDTHHHQGCGSNTWVGCAPLRELYCCLRVNLSGQPYQMATPADGLGEGGMRRPEGPRARREPRQRAEARLRLRLVEDTARLGAHSGGPRFGSQSRSAHRQTCTVCPPHGGVVGFQG